MPNLLETISEYEEDLLMMIAEQWGIEPEHIAGKRLAGHLAQRITRENLAREFLQTLPDEPLAALAALASYGGRIPWPQFERKYGKLREMGAARRERERPDIQPVSITESLFYKGLIGKAFFESRGSLREFAFIPDDFLDCFKPGGPRWVAERLSPAADSSIQKKFISSDAIIDHADTALAALRAGRPLDQLTFNRPDIPVQFIMSLLRETEMARRKNTIDTEGIRQFLEAPRPQALAILFGAWRTSASINEVVTVTNLKFEKNPRNDSRAARFTLLDILASLPPKRWFEIDDVINAIHAAQPDILRQGGEYEAWPVTDPSSGRPLAGFDHWFEVEGQYLRGMINGPLFWFGLVDLAKTRGKALMEYLRLTEWAARLLEGKAPDYRSLEAHNFILGKDGRITLERYFPRDIHYQIARFCEWGAQKGNRYEYRITPASLAHMATQGLTVRQLLSLLQKYARKPVPPNILKGLERWENHRLEACISQGVLITVRSGQILDDLMNPTLQKYIIKRLNEETALVHQEGIPFIQSALLDMGIFSQKDESGECG